MSEPKSDPPIDLRGRGWRATVPSAVLIALVTTIGTSVSTQCTSPIAELRTEQRRQSESVARRLDAIEAGQRAILERVETDTRTAANRDAIQTLQIEALRNR